MTKKGGQGLFGLDILIHSSLKVVKAKTQTKQEPRVRDATEAVHGCCLLTCSS